MRRVLCLVCSATVLLIGCGGNRETIPVEAEQPAIAREGYKIADAYLFDCKLKRNGKTNSFRLELFVTDSIAGFSGRGYLGKGVLQGVLRPDSLFAAFPTTHEYVTEDIKSLLRLSQCVSEFSDSVVLAMLQPISQLPFEDTNIKLDDFVLSPIADSCPMKLSVSYKKKKAIYRPNKLEFFDGKATRLTATCREVRGRVKIPLRRFQFSPPEAGIRIFP